MDDRIRFITHQGKQILLVDVSHCSAAELLKISRVVPHYVMPEPRGSVLLLADFTGAEFDVARRPVHPAVILHRPPTVELERPAQDVGAVQPGDRRTALHAIDGRRRRECLIGAVGRANTVSCDQSIVIRGLGL